MKIISIFFAVIYISSSYSVASESIYDTESKYKFINDFIAATYLKEKGEVLFGSKGGKVGLMKLNGDAAYVNFISSNLKSDITTIENISESEALIGTSDGSVHRYKDRSLEKIVALSSHRDPILDIAKSNGTFVVAGARGLLAKSDNESEWSLVEVRNVKQSKLKLPHGKKTTWRLGEFNIDYDSFSIDAKVDNSKIEKGKHYEIYPEEGIIEIFTDLDSDSKLNDVLVI